MKLFLIILILFSCQKQKPKAPKQRSLEVAAKAELYKALHKGWAHDKCDSLGFTALAKLAGGSQDADILKAEGDPGRWYRSPEHDCYDLGQSASDISKDMFIMLLPYLYATGDKQNIKEIYDYGQKNGWVMGRGPISRTFLTPGIVLLIQELLGHFGFVESTEIKEGFEKHLDVIFILTSAMKRGGVNDVDYETLRKLAEKAPHNALFQAAYHRFKDGDQSKALEILLRDDLFPVDRLPESRDRCEAYLWQRDEDPKDWSPCDQGKTHDGVDFIFAAWVAGQI